MPMLHTCANPARIPILVYHQIDTPPPKGAAYRSLYVSPAAFARHMWLLNMLGYQGLSMAALMPYLAGEQHGKVVGITFDDGYLNNLTHALPVLQQHGFSSTCYCVSQRLGQTNVWDQANGVAQAPLMTAAQLRQWVAGGQEVGAHTRHHVLLPQCDEATCQQEILQCKSELEAASGSAVRHFCYPYGQYTAQHLALARQAGYDTVTSTQRGRVAKGANVLELPRVSVLRTTTLPVLWLKVATGYEDRRAA